MVGYSVAILILTISMATSVESYTCNLEHPHTAYCNAGFGKLESKYSFCSLAILILTISIFLISWCFSNSLLISLSDNGSRSLWVYLLDLYFSLWPTLWPILWPNSYLGPMWPTFGHRLFGSNSKLRLQGPGFRIQLSRISLGENF